MKCNVWKSCSDQCWQDKLQYLIWIFFEQSAFVNIHLLYYWPTIHNLISKICPKFQILSSHFFQVDELLDEHEAKINSNLCNKMYQSKVCVQEFWYFVSGLDIQVALYIFYFTWISSVAISRLQSGKSLHYRGLPLFWRTWTRALARAQLLAWHTHTLALLISNKGRYSA